MAVSSPEFLHEVSAIPSESYRRRIMHSIVHIEEYSLSCEISSCPVSDDTAPPERLMEHKNLNDTSINYVQKSTPSGFKELRDY